jgi:predicted dehydrogenase
LVDIPKTHRILDPVLGGGALLDLGPYPLIWALLFLYENPANGGRKPTSITGSMLKTPLTGVDASTSFTVAFGEGHQQAHGVLTCNITLPAMEPCVHARFRNGNIIIPSGIFRPTSFVVQWFDAPGSGKIAREERRNFEYTGFGWHFQADEVARCVREGKLESDLWGHDKSLVEMEIFDKVLAAFMQSTPMCSSRFQVRRQGGYKLPEGVEKVV